jgi:histidinol-phosphate aminotransferase
VLRPSRDDLVGWLRAHGRTVADSDANFVLFGVVRRPRRRLAGLLDRGVLIRNTGPSGWLRVTVGTPAENDAFRAPSRR